MTPTLKARDLIESLPVLGRVARVEWGDIATIASFAVTLADMHAVAAEAQRAFDEGCDGVVITHGTDTIEETAYALALMLPRGKSISVTGAMRNPTLPGADGPGNLAAAFMVAAHPGAHGLGPVLVFNDEIHAARFATKSHSTRPSTIVSAGAGPIGEVIEETTHVWFAPSYEDYVGMPDAVPDATVPLIKAAADLDDALMRAAIAQSPPAIVLEGFGGGHVPLSLLEPIDDAVAAGIAVVMAPRVLAGRTLERTYRMPGGETDLIERGVIPGGHLSGHKARLRLMVGLALGLEPASLFPVL